MLRREIHDRAASITTTTKPFAASRHLTL